jgi:GH24 family phage-related lysozyme (muramidase)
LDLILSFEGFDQPGHWPGASSGITLPIGYDLGYKTLAQFRSDWGHRLHPATMTRLERAIGVKGQAAKALAPQFRDIAISRAPAEEVFNRSTIPSFVAQTRRAFPGVERLPADAEGALVSLVFNRGASMTGDSRREMREVRDAVAAGDLREIAAAIRRMKRLWEGKGLAGLLRRRDAEADLVESTIPEDTSLATVNASSLNLRQSPGGTLIAGLPRGTKLTVEDMWAQVRTADGRSGWVSAKFLDLP